jgi:hypothetical protein
VRKAAATISLGVALALPAAAAPAGSADARGNLQRVRLGLPTGTILPARLRGYVIADVFPILARPL